MELEEKIKTLTKAVDILFSEKEKQTVFRSICIDFEPELFALSKKEKTQKNLKSIFALRDKKNSFRF